MEPQLFNFEPHPLGEVVKIKAAGSQLVKLRCSIFVAKYPDWTALCVGSDSSHLALLGGQHPGSFSAETRVGCGRAVDSVSAVLLPRVLRF